MSHASIDDLESSAWLDRPITRIVLKNNGRSVYGRLVGTAYGEDSEGRRVASFGSLARKDAERLAVKPGRQPGGGVMTRRATAAIVLPRLTCKRCGHAWVPRRPVVKICPRCKSLLWDVPKARTRLDDRSGQIAV